MLLNTVKILLAIPLGAILYLYDDALWGPVPIAFASRLLGWPIGFLLLCLLYLVVSFTACFLILKHYRGKTGSKKPSRKELPKGHKAVIYQILLSGRWIGLAVSCFTLGAILTSIAVGKFNLFKDISAVYLASIMSILFVGLFMGFYGGLFAYLVKYGVLRTLIIGFLALATIQFILTLARRHNSTAVR